MDRYEFFSNVIGALAWPAVAVFLVLRYEDRVAPLIDFVKKLKLGPLELEFERMAKEVEALAKTLEEDDILVPSPHPSSQPEAGSGANPASASRPFGNSSSTEPGLAVKVATEHELRVLAAARPSAAIIESWRLVEAKMLELISELGIFVSPRSTDNPRAWILAIEKHPNLLPPSTGQLLHDLYVLRNQVAHSSLLDPTPAAAQSYVESAESLVRSMSRAIKLEWKRRSSDSPTRPLDENS